MGVLSIGYLLLQIIWSCWLHWPWPPTVRMTISSFKSQSTVLLQKRVERPHQVDDGILPQVKRLKYPGIIFSSEERFEWEIDRQIVAASAFKRTLQVEELNGEAEFSICSLIYISSLTYGQELWVRTERLKSYSRFSKIRSWKSNPMNLSVSNQSKNVFKTKEAFQPLGSRNAQMHFKGFGSCTFWKICLLA